MTPYERLLLPESLIYAWQKAKRLYASIDGYFDAGELADFELDIERRLKLIHRQFSQGRYKLKKIRPVPRPKKITEDGSVRCRQYFHISVDDQVAWVAVVNALGPELDKLMPPWSYGNRLYRPAWYEEDVGSQSRLEIGPYRHVSGHLYRKFQHSWPLFRRHIALTARKMAAPKLGFDDLDEGDQLAWLSAEKEKLGYLRADFWRKDEGRVDLYCASIDLKQFYPSINRGSVIRGLRLADAHDPMRAIVEDMLSFQVDMAELPGEVLERVEPPICARSASGIPTGLFVAGFLANAAMLPIDLAVDREIKERRSIAHFRFVDDHTVLAFDFDELCEWIGWYRRLLTHSDIGADVNEEKYDPDSLCKWMQLKESSSQGDGGELSSGAGLARSIAVRDTRIDGSNPVKLLTKTLEQVSAIAAANIDIMDDGDLRERLKFLEWLLLADIPSREIRSDTRAAFAAGQIAALAPVLIQEGDGLIDEARTLAHLNSQTRKSDEAGKEPLSAALREKSRSVAQLQEDQERHDAHFLRHCFNLLLQALQEHPGKARLFYRVHQYCRVTGHKGLGDISTWIKKLREKKETLAWSDYYAGLSLQIISGGLLQAVGVIMANDSLRSDKLASAAYLEDIANLDFIVFSVHETRRTWFHSVGHKEFGVSLLAAAEVIKQKEALIDLGRRLRILSARFVKIAFDAPSDAWVMDTGWSPGVWAHRVEAVLGGEVSPSAVWKDFEQCFSWEKIADRRAERRYPEFLSEISWNNLLQSEEALSETDSGWVREALDGKPQRIIAASRSKKRAFLRAARSYSSPQPGWITLSEWTKYVRDECSAFDPRRSEWTALEIVRQIVSPVTVLGKTLGIESLTCIHPNNILVSEAWASSFAAGSAVSWEQWRAFATKEGWVKLRSRKESVIDYRYFYSMQDGRILDAWERILVAVGRVLLGLLRFDHRAPRVWNFRGNENVVFLPRSKEFQALAISSMTLVFLEACLSGRSAETRAISRQPSLFGWTMGVAPNDTDFDPPPLFAPNLLLKAIEESQRILVDNQLAATLNQPRQLIPFRLSDFSVGPVEELEGGVLGE